MLEKELENYELPAHLRKKDGYWHTVIDAKHPKTGKKIRHSKSTKIKVEGENKTETKSNKIKAGAELLKFQKKWSDYYFKKNNEEKIQDILFVDFLKNWLNTIKYGLQPNTIRGYTVNVERVIIPYFKQQNLLLKELKVIHIQRFYEYCLSVRKVKPSTIERYHANLRKALQSAFKQELILYNPADLVDLPKKDTYIANVLPIFELLKILKEIEGTDLELPTFFSVYYGLRRGEAGGLLWSNIDFDNKQILIGNTLIEGEHRELLNRKGGKTKSSYRTLELIPEVEKFLLEIKEKQEKYKKIYKKSYNYKYANNICVKKDGDIIKLDYITKKFKEITRKLGYEDIHFHCLRHSFATNMYSEGMDMKDLQKWLGHSTLSTTMDLYVHFLEKRIKESAKILENAMKKGEKERLENNKKNHIY